MPADNNPSKVNLSQVAAKDLTAGGDIQIGSIVQNIVYQIVYLGLPFNGRNLRFVQLLANSTYFACLTGGFIRLWQNEADLTTIMLLIIGSVLLSLTCLYYAWFWKPEVQDKSAPSSEQSDSDERMKAQQTKQRSRQQTRYLAIIGMFAIPLLTCGSFLIWQSLPPAHILLLVADFDGVEQQNYQVTETILRNLQNATKTYADVKVQALNQTITEQQGSEFARAEGEQKKAAIVIWGEYGITPTHVQISPHFEVLKSPDYYPQLGATAKGEAQILAIAELNSFKLQTRLSNEMSYLTLFTLGVLQHAREDWNGATIRFTAALDQMKEPVKALDQEVIYNYRGISYSHKSDYQNATADFNQALKLKPDNAWAYNNRGATYSLQSNLTQAIADFNQALKLEPNYVDAYNNRGVAYSAQGSLTQAITDFNQALKLKSDYAMAYNNRGNTHAKQGNYTQAIADFTQTIQLNPDYVEAYISRGNSYDDQGEHNRAIANYNQALQLEPDNASAYFNRGIAYDRQGNHTQAIVDFNRAIQLNPNLAEAYYSRGIAYTAQGNLTQAIANYNQALKLKSDYATAYINRGSVYHSQSKYSEAIADYNQAIKLKSDYATAYINRGSVYHSQSKYSEAIADYNQAIKLNPDEATTYNNRGSVYYSQGKYSEAIADYNQAIKLNPDEATAYNNRGVVYYNQGKYSEAITDYNQALKLDPDYALAYYNRARIHSSERKVQAAIENLQQAIHLDATWRENAKTDSDFDNIRQDEQFQALVGQ